MTEQEQWTTVQYYEQRKDEMMNTPILWVKMFLLCALTLCICLFVARLQWRRRRATMERDVLVDDTSNMDRWPALEAQRQSSGMLLEVVVERAK